MAMQGEAWSRTGSLDVVLEAIAPRFAHAGLRRAAAAYMHGLLAPAEYKQPWSLAEAAGEATGEAGRDAIGDVARDVARDVTRDGEAAPDGVQHFLSRAGWDAGAVRDDLQAYVARQLGDPGAVLVLDETGFIKNGSKSAGVQRQGSGTAGRIRNSQVGVFLGYASRHGCALLDRTLYLPTEWAADAERRRKAYIPPEVAFATKPALGLAMLDRARAAGVPCAWVAGEGAYGADEAIRRWAEQNGRGYVLAVASQHRLGTRSAASWVKGLPERAWTRLGVAGLGVGGLGAGDGAGEAWPHDWAWISQKCDRVGFQCGLLVRRSVTDPADRTFYLTHAPVGTTLAELVRVAGAPRCIESLFEQAKGEVGLGHYEVRSWIGWYRHITLAMFALAHLAAVRRGGGGRCGSGGAGRRSGVGRSDSGRSDADWSDADDRGRGRATPAASAVTSAAASPGEDDGASLARALNAPVLVSLATPVSATCPPLAMG